MIVWWILRRTALAFFLAPRYATPVLLGKSFRGHKKDMHLNRLRQVYDFDTLSGEAVRCSNNKRR